MWGSLASPPAPHSALRAPPRDLRRIGNAPQGGEARVPQGQPALGAPEALSRASSGHRCQVKSKGPHQPRQTFGLQPDRTSGRMGTKAPVGTPGSQDTFVAAAVRGPGVDGREEGLGSARSRVPGSAELHRSRCLLTSKGLRGCTHAGGRGAPARGAGLHPAPTLQGSSWASTWPPPAWGLPGPPPGPHPPGVFLGTRGGPRDRGAGCAEARGCPDRGWGALVTCSFVQQRALPLQGGSWDRGVVRRAEATQGASPVWVGTVGPGGGPEGLPGVGGGKPAGSPGT